MGPFDRYEHMRVVASQVEAPGVELDVEVRRDHPLGVDDQIGDFAYATPVAVDDFPPARVGFVGRDVESFHA
jgi:hypothetical protein